MTDTSTTLDALRTIDALDQKINEAQRVLDELPREQADLDAAVTAAEQALAAAEQAFSEKDAERAAKEEELNTERDNVKKSQNRLNTVKNNMEYSAVMREINAMKRDASILEETVLGLMEELEGLDGDRSAKKDALEKAREQRANRIDQITEELKTAEGKKSEMAAERETLSADIPADAFRRYDRVRARYDTGPVIVGAHNERCTGCHMNIPPQIYNTVRRAEQLVQCPNCSRLLFWQEEASAEDAAAEASAPV